MDKNLVYRCLKLHFADMKNIAQISEQTGLRKNVVLAILKGIREPKVATDFFTDRKAGDFSRTYPLPEYNKLSLADYIALEQRYMSLIYSGKATVNDVKSYLIEDSIEPEQAEKMLKSLEAFCQEKRSEQLDVRLLELLDILSRPAKWRMTDAGLVTVYPIPVLDENYRVIAVEYQDKRGAFFLPDDLWERYSNKEAM
ncbi:hypothetical protein QNH39_18850 [Neobacillus novalis]|uniref:Uncharacterized protein n=1 Tax=Neobacillus novalis TaxID=220687 RepID=A0AA95MJF0_9BACI|nr:hypothetical protein [Neobacillus novalis]WHY84695.1 hypothetical protein QNH39_18850 [Neobacillus novalis]